MKKERNDLFPDEPGNAIPVGQPGAGKRVILTDLIFTFSHNRQAKQAGKSGKPGGNSGRKP